MKKLFTVILWYIFMAINLPILLIMGLISLWHWDISYFDKFGSHLANSLDHIMD